LTVSKPLQTHAHDANELQAIITQTTRVLHLVTPWWCPTPLSQSY